MQVAQVLVRVALPLALGAVGDRRGVVDVGVTGREVQLEQVVERAPVGPRGDAGGGERLAELVAFEQVEVRDGPDGVDRLGLGGADAGAPERGHEVEDPLEEPVTGGGPSARTCESWSDTVGLLSLRARRRYCGHATAGLVRRRSRDRRCGCVTTRTASLPSRAVTSTAMRPSVVTATAR